MALDLDAVHPPGALPNRDSACCGRKLVAYPRPPQLYCSVCEKGYDPVTLGQAQNHAWEHVPQGFRLSAGAACGRISRSLWQVQKDSGLEPDVFRQVVLADMQAFVQQREGNSHG